MIREYARSRRVTSNRPALASLVRAFSIGLALLFQIELQGVSAAAITIDGLNYKKMLSVSSNQDFGYWTSMDKFYTFISNDNYIRPISVSSVGFRDDSLANVSVRQVFAMGTVDGALGPVNSGTVELYGASNELLLRAQYASNGSATPTFASGYAGQIDVNGVFTATGGSLFTSGVLPGPLYIQIAFDYVWKNSYADLKARVGTFTFYQLVGGEPPPPPPPPPPNEVPEPMSCGLLLMGLAGAAARRKARFM